MHAINDCEITSTLSPALVRNSQLLMCCCVFSHFACVTPTDVIVGHATLDVHTHVITFQWSNQMPERRLHKSCARIASMLAPANRILNIREILLTIDRQSNEKFHFLIFNPLVIRWAVRSFLVPFGVSMTISLRLIGAPERSSAHLWLGVERLSERNLERTVRWGKWIEALTWIHDKAHNGQWHPNIKMYVRFAWPITST